MGSINPIALRELRAIRGLTVRALAEAAGISNGYLTKIETGLVSRPRPDVIDRLAIQLNVPVAVIAPQCRHDLVSTVPARAASA